MNKKKRKRNTLSVLIVMVLAVMAFARGPLQIWLLVGAFCLWGVYAGFPSIYRMHKKRKASKFTPSSNVGVPKLKPKAFDVLEFENDSKDDILLQHVNFRISSYLKSVYPDAKWEWCESEPQKLILKGGTGKIKLFGVSDFNFANIIFSDKATINCDMVKIVPLTDVNKVSTPLALEVKKESEDPSIWYELKGREVLENVIGDLSSRGFSNLTIKDNGDICIMQDEKENCTEKLKDFPSKNVWQNLAKIFEKEGLAAAVNDADILLSW